MTFIPSLYFEVKTGCEHTVETLISRGGEETFVKILEYKRKLKEIFNFH